MLDVVGLVETLLVLAIGAVGGILWRNNSLVSSLVARVESFESSVKDRFDTYNRAMEDRFETQSRILYSVLDKILPGSSKEAA